MKTTLDTSRSKAKDDPRPYIPDGKYEAQCIDVELSNYRGSQKKLYLHFKIIEGPHQGTKLFEVCNYYERVPRGSKYYKQWPIANGGLPTKSDSMSPKVFLNKIFRVEVRTVTPKHDDGKPLPEMYLYSVVDKILAKSAG